MCIYIQGYIKKNTYNLKINFSQNPKTEVATARTKLKIPKKI